jgi:hypothetical protein
MNGLRQGGRDLLRIVRGIHAFLRCVWSAEDCHVGLGLFAAATHMARKRQSSRYVARIANAGRDPLGVALTIDIRAGQVPELSTGHYASFTKRLTAQPRTAEAITVEYDWMEHAIFHTDGRASPSDHFWKGSIGTPQLYAVTALLTDSEGRRLDALTVYQELTE